MRFFSFFLKPTRRKRAVSIAAITAASIVAAIALILWLLPQPEAPHRLQGSWQCDGFFLTADAQNLCLNGLCFAYELLEPLEENPQADCPQLFVLDACAANITLRSISCTCRWTGRRKFFLRLSLLLLRR